MDNNPLVSFCLFTYNQERFIEDALMGALSQDYDNLEIIVSDDHSSDKTAEIIKTVLSGYCGPHKIIVNINDTNLGLVGNFNKMMTISHGQYIVLAAGDDISNSNRVSYSLNLLLHNNAVSGAMGFEYIDANGNPIKDRLPNKVKDDLLIGLKEYLHSPLPGVGPSRVFSRSLVDIFGPLNNDCPTEDTTLSLRSFLIGPMAITPEIGVKYRIHGNNVSSEDNLYKRIDSDKIFKQYKHDLVIARKDGLILFSDYLKLKKKIGYYRILESTKRKFYANKSSLARILYAIRFLVNPYSGLSKRTLITIKCFFNVF